MKVLSSWLHEFLDAPVSPEAIADAFDDLGTPVEEEVRIGEGLDGIEELRDNNLPVGAVIVNMERGPRLTPEGLRDALDGTLDVDEVRAGVEAAELPRKLNVNTVTKVLMTEAAEHAERVQLEQTERDRLNAAERPIYELPEMNGGIDLGALYAMARMLREQGVA